MARRWGPTVPITLLVAAGVGFGVLGARAIRLESEDASRRARVTAEEVVRSAAAVAPTRAAEGLGTPTDAFTLGPPPKIDDGIVVPDDARLLLDQALYLERRGDTSGAAAMYFRVALRKELGGVATAAHYHSIATSPRDRALPLDIRVSGPAPASASIAPNDVTVIEASAFVPPDPGDATSLDGVPLSVWAAYLRVADAARAGAPIDELRARVVDLLATPGVERVRTDGGPDAADCVLSAIDAIGPRIRELPRQVRDDLIRAKARALVSHRVMRALIDAPIAAADGFIAAKDRANPTLVRLVPVAEFASALSSTLRTSVGAATTLDEIPVGAPRMRAPAPLDGLLLYAVPDPGPTGGRGPWLLLAGVLAVYAFGAGATILALARSRRAQRMQADFVAAVSHEMKTPVAGVRAMAEMLADGRVTDPQKAHVYAERIRAEMDRLGASVRDVLDAARIERDPTSVVRPRPAEPSDVVLEAAAIVRPALERRGFVLEVDARPADGPFVLDPDAISHVLHNLLDNAAKFSAAMQDEGGEGASRPREITVRGALVNGSTTGTGRDAKEGDAKPSPVGHAKPVGPGARYRIEVLDRGPGVPAGERSRVFERFVRGEAARRGAVPGVGLGLHVAKALVAAHGGTISVTDREGGGARFIVEIPERPA